MTPGTIYTHDRNQLVVRHEASGYYAIAPRDLVLAADPAAIRTGFRTSFFRPSITPVFLPRGEARIEPTAQEIRWRDAVAAALDVFVGMNALNREFCDLQALWRGEHQETL